MIGLGVAVISVALDQWSKWFLIHLVTAQSRGALEITSFFNLVMVWNHGISFGLLAAQNQPMFLLLVSAAIVLILLRWLSKAPFALLACALGAIIGGAVGNMIDRWRFGAVADFFDVHAGGWHWPAFNIADSAIFMGVVVLCATSMFSKDERPSGLSNKGMV